MATVRATITRGMRKLRILAAGAQPKASEAADGLAVVQGMFDSFATNGMFGRLNTLLSDNASGLAFSTDDDICEVTVWEALPGDPSVELPVRVRDKLTGEQRTPPDLSFIEVVDETTGTRKTYLWDARRAQWGRIDSLGLDDEMPLSARSTEGMAAIVATRLADEFGAQVGPLLLREAGQFMFGLSSRYGEARRASPGDYF